MVSLCFADSRSLTVAATIDVCYMTQFPPRLIICTRVYFGSNKHTCNINILNKIRDSALCYLNTINWYTNCVSWISNFQLKWPVFGTAHDSL